MGGVDPTGENQSPLRLASLKWWLNIATNTKQLTVLTWLWITNCLLLSPKSRGENWLNSGL